MMYTSDREEPARSQANPASARISAHYVLRSDQFTATQPHRTMTEKKYLVYGFDTKNDRHDVLGYLASSKAEAYALCKQCHPLFDVYSVREAAPDQY